jgi:hypothetical protein
MIKRNSVAVAIALLVLGIGAAKASTIDIDTLLLNPSFELGADFTCPTSWTCGGSGGAVTHIITSSEYTAGADGLSGGKIVPDGTKAALSPNAISGTGTLAQTLASTVWTLGNTYTFEFWVGVPLVNPNGGHSTAVPDTINVYFTANGVQNTLPLITVPPPTVGQWEFVTGSVTPSAGAAYLGQNVGVEFDEACTAPCNNKVVNFDIATTGVPEPATFALLGLGLLGIGVVRRKLR